MGLGRKKLNDILSKAIVIATELHNGQVDRAKQPYILHPLRVMMNVSSVEAKILAVLHDVKEDCDITDDELVDRGIPLYLVEKLDLLTKKEGEDYFNYILRAKSDELTREVKEADLDDNMDLSRLVSDIDKSRMHEIDYLKTLVSLNEKHIQRFEKYQTAKRILNE